MPCSVSIGLGPNPHTGAFNEDVYEGLVEMVEANRSLTEVAWEQKMNPPSRPRLMPGSKPDETLATKALTEPFQREAS